MKERFEEGLTFLDFLDTTKESQHPWREFYERARLPEGLEERVARLEGRWHLLALCEDWCGDGANTLPYVARLAEAVSRMELRVLARDQNLDLMDAHLTRGGRAIPVVMILDEMFREVGWWGPRPAPLQEYFNNELRPLPKEERYPRLRSWYARDRGKTSLTEVLDRIPFPGLR